MLSFSTSQEIRVIKPSIHDILARAKTTPTSRPNTVQPSGLDEAETRDKRQETRDSESSPIHKTQLRGLALKFLGGEIKIN